MAIDREPAAIYLLESKIPAEERSLVQLRNASYEEAQFVPADLIYAGLSVPFCAPAYFAGMWCRLIESLRIGGQFAGHFFGDRDTWSALSYMTCLPRQAIESLFRGFAIEYFDESENDNPTAWGELKHWHLFEIIAQKQK